MIKAEDELDRGVLNVPAAQWFCFVHDEHSFTYRSKPVIKKKCTFDFSFIKHLNEPFGKS